MDAAAQGEIVVQELLDEIGRTQSELRSLRVAFADTQKAYYDILERYKQAVDPVSTQALVQPLQQAYESTHAELEQLRVAFADTQKAYFDILERYKQAVDPATIEATILPWRDALEAIQKERDQIKAAYDETLDLYKKATDPAATEALTQPLRQELGATRGALEQTQEALAKTQNIYRDALDKTHAELDQVKAGFEKTKEAYDQTAELYRQATDPAAIEAIIQPLKAELAGTQAAFTQSQSAYHKTLELYHELSPDPVAWAAQNGNGADAAEHSHEPSILISAIPKSGGFYTYQTLQRGLGYSEIDVTINIFPDDVFVYGQLIRPFKAGKRIAHHHVEASAVNLWYLRLLDLKAVIHVRDPRSCIVSWIHHLKARHKIEDMLDHPVIAPPSEYFSFSFEKQVDWMIANHLAIFNRWIERWVDVYKQPDMKKRLLFTRHDDLVSDRLGMIFKILDFYGIPHDRYHDQNLPKIEKYNYRSGKLDEWREVFSPKQKKEARKHVSDRVLQTFGWRA